MKHLRWLFWVLLLVLVFGFSVQARSYRVLDLVINLQLDAQGLLHVAEERVVQFQGPFSGFYQYIETGGKFAVLDVKVAVDGVPYKRWAGDQPGPAGTFYVSEKEGKVLADWSFSAEDEVRVFTLSYVLEGVVLKHADVAELFYKFVGDQWVVPQEKVKVTLSLPAGAQREAIKAWGHGPAHGKVRILSASEVEWEISPLPAETFLEGRVTFPSALLPALIPQSGEEALPRIIAEENRWLQKEERARRYQELDLSVVFVALSVGAGVFYLLWQKYGKEYAPQFKDKYCKTLPATYPPAELAILYRRRLGTLDLVATILDLARRGFLVIEEVLGPRRVGKSGESYRFIQKPGGEEALLGYEQALLDLLFTTVGEGQVDLEGIQEYAKKEGEVFPGFWAKWRAEVEKEAKKHRFFEEDGQQKKRWFYLPSALSFAFGFFFFLPGMFLTGAAFLLISFFFLAAALSGPRRTVYGSNDYAKWRAFRRYLRDFSRLEDARFSSRDAWEGYIAYAVSLGVATRAIKELQLVFPASGEKAHFTPAWFIYQRPGGLGRLARMATTVEHSFASATGQTSGAGGGFSGGGGGGLGGGGGGAR